MNRYTFTENVDTLIRRAHDILEGSVFKTLGPRGRHVFIDTPYGPPTVTKDGVTVMQNLVLSERDLARFVELYRQASEKTAKTAGDGTTTSVVLAVAFTKALLRLRDLGFNVLDAARRFVALSELVGTYVENEARRLDLDRVEALANVVSSYDDRVTQLVKRAYELSVDPSLPILVEDTPLPSSEVVLTSGYVFDRSYVSSAFAYDSAEGVVVLSKPLVLVTDQKIARAEDIVPFLEILARTSRSGIVVADDFGDVPIALAATNHVRGLVQVCLIKAPSYGENRLELLKDIAAYASTKVFSANLARPFSSLTVDDLGEVTTARIDRSRTTLSNETPSPSIEERKAAIYASLLGTDPSDFFHQQAAQRLSKLASNVVTIKVGAPTESHQRELKSKLDDCLRAVAGAVQNGYIPSIASYLVFLSTKFERADPVEAAFADALVSVLETVLDNAGRNRASYVVETLRSQANSRIVYDARTDNFVDYEEALLIDPASVAIAAVVNAASTASVVATIASALVLTEDPYQPSS